MGLPGSSYLDDAFRVSGVRGVAELKPEDAASTVIVRDWMATGGFMAGRKGMVTLGAITNTTSALSLGEFACEQLYALEGGSGLGYKPGKHGPGGLQLGLDGEYSTMMRGGSYGAMAESALYLTKHPFKEGTSWRGYQGHCEADHTLVKLWDSTISRPGYRPMKFKPGRRRVGPAFSPLTTFDHCLTRDQIMQQALDIAYAPPPADAIAPSRSTEDDFMNALPYTRDRDAVYQFEDAEDVVEEFTIEMGKRPTATARYYNLPKVRAERDRIARKGILSSIDSNSLHLQSPTLQMAWARKKQQASRIDGSQVVVADFSAMAQSCDYRGHIAHRGQSLGPNSLTHFAYVVDNDLGLFKQVMEELGADWASSEAFWIAITRALVTSGVAQDYDDNTGQTRVTYLRPNVPGAEPLRRQLLDRFLGAGAEDSDASWQGVFSEVGIQRRGARLVRGSSQPAAPPFDLAYTSQAGQLFGSRSPCINEWSEADWAWTCEGSSQYEIREWVSADGGWAASAQRELRRLQQLQREEEEEDSDEDEEGGEDEDEDEDEGDKQYIKETGQRAPKVFTQESLDTAFRPQEERWMTAQTGLRLALSQLAEDASILDIPLPSFRATGPKRVSVLDLLPRVPSKIDDLIRALPTLLMSTFASRLLYLESSGDGRSTLAARKAVLASLDNADLSDERDLHPQRVYSLRKLLKRSLEHFSVRVQFREEMVAERMVECGGEGSYIVTERTLPHLLRITQAETDIKPTLLLGAVYAASKLPLTDYTTSFDPYDLQSRYDPIFANPSTLPAPLQHYTWDKTTISNVLTILRDMHTWMGLPPIPNRPTGPAPFRASTFTLASLARLLDAVKDFARFNVLQKANWPSNKVDKLALYLDAPWHKSLRAAENTQKGRAEKRHLPPPEAWTHIWAYAERVLEDVGPLQGDWGGFEGSKGRPFPQSVAEIFSPPGSTRLHKLDVDRGITFWYEE